MHDSIFILCGDPGFAHFGVAVVELRGPGGVLRPVYGTVIETEKTQQKRGVYAADDNFRRMRELFSALSRIAEQYNVSIAVHESVSMPRNASAAAKIAASVGVLASMCEMRGIPTVQSSPQAIKKAVCGASSASKREVAEALCARWAISTKAVRKTRCKNPLPRAQFIDTAVRDGDVEHVWDALASVVAAQSSDVVRALVSRAGL